jgi:putative heme-binding domain-containing protein
MKLFAVLTIVVCPLAGWAQGNLANLNAELGKAVFRSNCAFCHGLTGTGGRGPNLAASRFATSEAGSEFKNIVRNGVPGTTMPAFETMETDELDNLALYIHELGAAGAKREPITGDAARGLQIYARNGCAGCHRIGDEGSIFGPDLSRVGVGRPSSYIRESILDPGKDIPEAYQGVTVVMRDGKRIGGIRINEDTFTVQLRDASQHFRMFDKGQVKEVIHETKSMMPAYTSLSQVDLNDLLAYLDTLRGGVNAGAEVKKARGIQ